MKQVFAYSCYFLSLFFEQNECKPKPDLEECGGLAGWLAAWQDRKCFTSSK